MNQSDYWQGKVTKPEPRICNLGVEPATPHSLLDNPLPSFDAQHWREEIALSLDVLKGACDRDWKDENAHQVMVIAANAIHWRNEEIAALRKENEALKAEVNEDCRRSSNGCGTRKGRRWWR